MPTLAKKSRLIRYSQAVLTVAVTSLAIYLIPIVNDWRRGSFVLLFFGITQVAFSLGLGPSLFALILSLVTLNTLSLDTAWVLNPSHAFIMNAVFCALSAIIITTIHKQQKLTKALFENQQDLKLAQSVAKIGNWRFDFVSKKLIWSDEIYHIFEIPKISPLNCDIFFSLIHPEDKEYVIQKWQAHLQGEAYDIEHRLLVGGTVKWVHELCQLEHDKKGVLLSAFGITQDITAQKQITSALAKKEHDLRLILDLSPQLIAYVDTDFRYLWINKTYESWWHKNPEEILGHEVRELVGEKTWNTIQPYMERARWGEKISFEHQTFNPDDSYRWVHVDYVPDIASSGSVKGILIQVANITVQKEAELRIYEQERQLQIIMNLTPVLISYLDNDFKYLRVNKTYEDWFGVAKEDVIGRSVREIIGEMAWENVAPYLERSLSGVTIRHDQKLWYSTEYYRWVDMTFVPNIDSSGEVKGIVIHVADIKESKLTEQALQDSNERMRLATESTGVGIWEWNINNNQLKWDTQMFRIYGIPPTEDGMITYNTWRDLVLPEDLPRQEEILQEIIRTFGHSSLEFRIQQPGKLGYRYIQASQILKRNEQGQAEWMVGTNVDITDRKLAKLLLIEREKELSLIIDSMPALIAYVGTDLRYKRVNTAYESWLGIPTDKIIGKEIKTIVGNSAWETIKPYLKKALSGETVLYELQMPYQSSTAKWIQGNYVPDFDESGNVIGIVALIVDIDKIKLAELEISRLNNALENRLEELQAILDTAPIGIAICEDNKGNSIRGNPELERMIGLPLHSELSHRHTKPKLYRVFEHGKELMVEELPIQQAVKGEKSMNRVLDILRPDGEQRTLLNNSVPIFDEKGNKRGAVGAFLDITALKNAEKTLEESQERLHLAQIAGGLGIFDYDLINGVMQWDERIREIWGLNPDDPINLETCKIGAHPDDRMRLKAAMDSAFDPQGNHVYHAEYRVIRATDNKLFWVAAYGITTFKHDKPARLVGFVQDISDRKFSEAKLSETEARLTLIMKELEAGFWSWNIKTDAVFLSPIWKQQLGYKDEELPNAFETWESHLHPDDKASSSQIIENYLSGRVQNYEIEFRLRHKDGSYRWIHSRATLMPDHDNQLNSLVGIHLDVTDFKKAQETNEQREKMEETFRLQVAIQTAAAIAHELNQPLTAISYFADAANEMISRESPDPLQLNHILESCSQQSLRAGDVIRQLLSVLHKSESHRESLDINKLIIETINFVKSQSLISAEINLNLANELPDVICNHMQIQKVLIILFQNSVDSMQKAETINDMITVSTTLTSNDPSTVKITVRDRGAGLPENVPLNNIFQPFFTTKPGGLGMGLAISRALVNSNGGKIWVEQNADVGLSFHLSLPSAS